MLSVYTRHYPPCTRTDIHYRRCQCPKWLTGTLEKRGYVRFSARTRIWAKAEAKAREMEKNLEGKISLSTAVAAYLGDEEARKLKPETVHQKRAFLEGELLPWCRQHAVVWLEQLRLPQVRQFAKPGNWPAPPQHGATKDCAHFLLFAWQTAGSASIPPTC